MAAAQSNPDVVVRRGRMDRFIDGIELLAAFFVGLGLEVEGRTYLEGDFLDTVSGLPQSRTEVVMLRPPSGGTGLELASFVRPDHQPGSPAAKAGLKAGTTQATIQGQTVVLGGDVITKIDGHEITTFDDLANGISSKKPGDTVQLEIVRDGHTMTVNVTLAAHTS